MADEDKKNDKNQIEELYAWISTIPLSKPTKNLSRDLSDAGSYKMIVLHSWFFLFKLYFFNFL